MVIHDKINYIDVQRATYLKFFIWELFLDKKTKGLETGVMKMFPLTTNNELHVIFFFHLP